MFPNTKKGIYLSYYDITNGELFNGQQMNEKVMFKEYNDVK
jgi:hypothetical protein